MHAVFLSLILSAAPSGQIAFVSGTEQEDQCVCVLDVASGAIVRVGTGKGDQAPVWSPGGDWLAFTGLHAEGTAIHVVRPDGSDLRALEHAVKWNRYPRWAPGGRGLVYAATDEMDMNTRIIVCDLSTGAETTWGGGLEGLTRPVWPSGIKLLHALRPDQRIDLGDMQTDLAGLDALTAEGVLLAIGLTGEAGKLSTDIFAVTEDRAIPLAVLVPKHVLPSMSEYAEWALEPNSTGSAFAFESNDGGDREIYVLNNRGLADVSNHRAADWNPLWSHDREWIAFESFRGGRRGVWRVYPDTARVYPVATAPDSDNWWPTWSPDGKWIAFVSDRTGNPEIFAVDVADGEVRQLTNQDTNDYAPCWRPE